MRKESKRHVTNHVRVIAPASRVESRDQSFGRQLTGLVPNWVKVFMMDKRRIRHVAIFIEEAQKRSHLRTE